MKKQKTVLPTYIVRKLWFGAGPYNNEDHIQTFTDSAKAKTLADSNPDYYMVTDYLGRTC